MPEVGIVAALEREVRPLVRDWRASDRIHSGRRFHFFESERCVAVCGGIGPEAARRATEAIASLYSPSTIWSVGFAGALEEKSRVGDLLEPRYVIDTQDGSKVDTGSGSGILVSFSSVAGQEQKARLAKAYQAQAVDMEAAAVAKGAHARALHFAVVKVISDEVSVRMPRLEQFMSEDGGLRSTSFALYAALRPWLWASLFRLARNSSVASDRLCEYLRKNVEKSSAVPAKVAS